MHKYDGEIFERYGKDGIAHGKVWMEYEKDPEKYYVGHEDLLNSERTFDNLPDALIHFALLLRTEEMRIC